MEKPLLDRLLLEAVEEGSAKSHLILALVN